MLVQSPYAIDSMAEIRRLIAGHSWAILLTGGNGGLRAAHVPCLLDPEHDRGGEAAALVVVGHTARRDPASLDLADGNEVLLVFQGPHGYVSPAWYGEGPFVPTWNFTAAHLYGIPQILDGEEPQLADEMRRILGIQPRRGL